MNWLSIFKLFIILEFQFRILLSQLGIRYLMVGIFSISGKSLGSGVNQYTSGHLPPLRVTHDSICTLQIIYKTSLIWRYFGFFYNSIDNDTECIIEHLLQVWYCLLISSLILLMPWIQLWHLNQVTDFSAPQLLICEMRR